MTDFDDLPRIIDTHTHLDEPAFDNDRDAIISGSRAVGVERMINIGFTPERWRSSAELSHRFSFVSITVGLHPQSAAELTPAVQRALETAAADMQPVGIGETGFDFARGDSSVDQQRRAFQFQASLADSLRLPLVIHQRDASDTLIAELDRWPGLSSIVLHSFDGSPRLADWARERRCYVGVGGLATRDAASSLRGLLSIMPADRLLLETDSPYLAPPGTPRRNTPAALPLIAERLAPLWGLTQKELCTITANNAERVFRLSDRES